MKKLSNEVNRILTIAQRENGQDYLDIKPLNPTDVVKNLLEEMTLQIQNARAIVKVDAPESSVRILGDLFHLKVAFRNLLDNALKYNTGHPEITIRIHQEDEQVIFQFDDNGIGINEEQRRLIFNKYHRTNGAKDVTENGFGLGLSYVKMVVQDHHGSIRVLDNARNGSCFELIIPAA